MKQLDYGCLVISLDFEMMWGCHDWSTVQEYGNTNIMQVRQVIKSLNNLFERYGIHATFATVGLIFCKDKNDAISMKPLLTPTYLNPIRSPFRKGYIEGIRESDEYLYFAPDVLFQLNLNSNIEIGSHTFSHFFCWEPGQNCEQFEADMKRAIEVARRSDVVYKSIIFPRNEVSKEYLDVCASDGFVAYRGNAKKYFEHTTNRWKGLYNKVSRLLDAYVNWGGNTSISYSEIDRNAKPMNVPASRMLRPYMRKLRCLEGLRLRRIKNEMKYAAKHHELYHLWWHPHNFGADMVENLAFLEKVLKCYHACHEKYGMRSYTMSEFVENISK